MSKLIHTESNNNLKPKESTMIVVPIIAPSIFRFINRNKRETPTINTTMKLKYSEIMVKLILKRKTKKINITKIPIINKIIITMSN